MARTRASVGAKVSSGKSSKARCSVAPPSSSTGSSGGGEKSKTHSGGGNPVCHRETPKWQRPITNFFICKDGPGAGNSDSDDDGKAAGSSKPKRNIIQSDSEDEQPRTENGETDLKTDNEETDQNLEDTEKATQNEEDKEIEVTESAEKPKNHVLDETIELEPLTGEDSHKIDEYYSKNSKGKGVGKKSKGKENLNVNVERRSSKRDLEEVAKDEDSIHASKKVKVN